jgi:hypothetical protein
MEDHILVEQRIMEALNVAIDTSDGSIINILLNQMLEKMGHNNILQKIHGSNVKTI